MRLDLQGQDGGAVLVRGVVKLEVVVPHTSEAVVVVPGRVQGSLRLAQRQTHQVVNRGADLGLSANITFYPQPLENKHFDPEPVASS